MGPPCHCLKSFFPAGQQFWGEIAPKMPYAHLYFKTTADKKQTEESRTGFNGFRQPSGRNESAAVARV
jgi:hypothetical protein